ncbi:MAG TPA: PIN domain-containing protein [Patescibacteria group bacterium]|nr:PIN domain-containing protein [Patescibacteria group bacterium]
MNYLADTHALVWYLTGDRRLSTVADELFQQAEKNSITLYIPTIVLAETEAVFKKKYQNNARLNLFLQSLSLYPAIHLYPFDEEVFVQYMTTPSHLEIHDRIIAATAQLTKSVIITKDSILRKAKDIKTVW